MENIMLSKILQSPEDQNPLFSLICNKKDTVTKSCKEYVGI